MMNQYENIELGNLLFGNSRGSFEVDREGLQDIFYLLEDYLGENFIYQEFKNDTFEIFPYYWGDCDCEDEHKPDCPLIRPNFVYKPTNLEIQWYKYPFRDSYSNRKFTKEEFVKIILDCIESIKKIGYINFDKPYSKR